MRIKRKESIGTSTVTTTPGGRTITTTTDNLGRPMHIEATGVPAIDVTYDRGRVSGVSQGGRNVTAQYTGAFASAISGPLGTTSFQRNAAGFVTQQVLPGGRTVALAPNENGNVTGVTPPGKASYPFSYTPVDLPQSGLDSTAAYTADRELSSVNRCSQQLDAGHDSMGRLTSLGPLSYSYDLNGNLTGVASPDGSIAFANQGFLPTSMTWSSSDTAGVAGTVSLGYNGALQLTSVGVPEHTIALTPDGDGFVTQAGALAISRSPGGFVTGTTLGGTSDTYTLTDFGEPLHYTATANGSPVYTAQYTRDGAGRITAKTETVLNPGTGGGDTHTAAYTYDAAGRLSQVQHDGVVAARHQYDDNGNRTGGSSVLCGVSAPAASPSPSATPATTGTAGNSPSPTATPTQTTTSTPTATPTGGAVISFNGSTIVLSATVDDHDRLTDVSLLDPFCTPHQYHYTYAPCGELQTKTEVFPDNPQLNTLTSYAYDAFGNLRTVDMPDGAHIEYLIDAANRRVGKKVNGTRVQGFLYQDALRPVAELDATNSVTRVFVYGSKGNVPDYIEASPVSGLPSPVYRLISDQVGSVRLVVDATTGAVVQRLDYDEYGAATLDTNPGFQPFGYAGGLYDPDTKIVRFGTRDYDPQTGRWTAKDPIGFDGGQGNLYAYVGGDPVNLIDPEGLEGATQVSQAGVDLIARFESFRASVYNDPLGHCTIGYGHLVHKGPCTAADRSAYAKPLSRSEASDLLRQDIETRAAPFVGEHVEDDLNQNQFDAITSVIFSTGVGNFHGSLLESTINSADLDAVPPVLRRSFVTGRDRSGRRVKLPGLLRRRASEAGLFAR